MSSGTKVTVERYYNRHHYHSIAEIDELINEKNKLIEQRWGEILSLCTATPKDITPTGEEPLSYVTSLLAELRLLIDGYEYDLQALCDIKDGWETKEED